jgi:molybdopterin-guanine dinucleotide biosynthesis protein A
MDAIVTAGGAPQPGDPLYEYTKGGNKALLDMAGKSMIQWVLDALENANTIEKVVLIGLPPESIAQGNKIAALLPSQGDMLNNIKAGVAKVLEIHPQAHHTLLVSSDIPGITGEMVDWVVNTSMQTDEDIYYNVITRQVMEKCFPNSRRSYTRLSDMEVCGGDMNMIRALTVTNNDTLWTRIIAARKSVFKQAALIGYDTLFLLLLRALSLEKAIKTVASRLKITGRALICPYAEVGMDVDKPHQLEIMREYLNRRIEKT